MIIDCHAHVASPKAIPHVFFDGWCDTVASQMPRTLSDRELEILRNRYYSLNSDEKCDTMIKEMDEAGIDKSVLLIIDFSHHFKEHSLSLPEVYQFHRSVTERHPDRFIAFAGVDPRNGTAGIELFETAIRHWGFKGMKLYPPCGYSPSDRKLDEYYQLCMQYQMPVLTHIGPTTSNMPFRYTDPKSVDDVAYRFPRVNFILGHAGVQHYQDAALLAEYRPNIYLDISGFQTELRRGEFANIIRYHRRKGILRKLLFGTDWPVHRMSGRQKNWVQAVRKLLDDSVITEKETNDLFSNNFLRMYGKD